MQAIAQIMLEHTYVSPRNFNLQNVDGEGYKYALVDANTTTLELYNLNHTVWKTTPLALPHPDADFQVVSASKNIIDNDADFEMIVYYYWTDNGLLQNRVDLINDDGSIVDSFPERNFYQIFNEPNNGWKMVLYHAVAPTIDYEIYTLPGSFIPLQAPNQQLPNAITQLSPNPVNTVATLRYTLPAGVHNATIIVSNAAGRQIATYPITDAFSDITLSRADLPSGVYFYHVVANRVGVKAQSFVIN